MDLKEIKDHQDIFFRFMKFLKQEGAVHVLQFCLDVGKVPWCSNMLVTVCQLKCMFGNYVGPDPHLEGLTKQLIELEVSLCHVLELF